MLNSIYDRLPVSVLIREKLPFWHLADFPQVEGNVGPHGNEKPLMSPCSTGLRNRRDSLAWVGLNHCHVLVVAVSGCGKAVCDPQGLGCWDS